MIVSYRHRYIFLHCRKTAGSSIAVSLASNLGARDVFLGGTEEAMQLGISLPRRIRMAAFIENPTAVATAALKGRSPYAAALSKYAKKRFSRIYGKKPQHVTAQTLSVKIPDEWGSFYKFCVVRNPFDLAVSDYFWRTRDVPEPPSFERYIQLLHDGDDLGGIVPIGIHSNWPIYTIDDMIAVDAIFRYEQLPGALDRGLGEAGIPFDGIVTRAKSSYRSGRAKSYVNVHTPATIELVGRLYEKEIETFGYRFES